MDIIRHFPPRIRAVDLKFGRFGKKFLEEVVRFVERSERLAYLGLYRTTTEEKNNNKDNSGEKEVEIESTDSGQEIGRRLADAVTTNKVLEILGLNGTDLVGPQNVGHWGDALLMNTELKRLWMDDCDEKMVLIERTWLRETNLTFR